jgi:putative glycosyltransferase (TIGR04348 family)
MDSSSDMARLFIVTPAGTGARNGNRHTALRWAGLLRHSGHRTKVALAWNGEACDALVALHARRSHESILRFREQRPAAPLVVVLTGTDLYRDLPESAAARRSLELADRVIVLQDAALREVDAATRRKARVVFQSSDTKLRHSPPANRLRISVIGHLREEKDPFRAVRAVSLLKGIDLEVLHLGAALDLALGTEARQWMEREPRYRWLGSVPHARALRCIAASHLLVHSSAMEGGANVIVEAARIGTPVIASRVSGNVGMLGARYPGLYPLRDEAALARLIRKSAEEKDFYRRLKSALHARRRLFAPAAEQQALRGVLAEIL